MPMTNVDPIPRDLREAFQEAVDSLPEWWEDGGLDEPAVRCGRGMSPISAVFGQVAQFKDQLPSDLLDFILRTIHGETEESLEIRRYGTYGVAGQCLRRLIERKKAERSKK
jgi:hypothetical protein